MEQLNLTLSDTPKRHPYLVFSDRNGQHYVFHAKKSVFFTLNPVAKDILDLCDGSNEVGHILRGLVERYDVPVKALTEDVMEYLVLLREMDVISLGPQTLDERR